MKHKKEKEQKPADEKQIEADESIKLSEELTRQKDELFEKLQRVSADYANFQKRVLKQIADNVGYEKEKIIKSLLPALDNFEHTLQNANSADNIDVLIKGIQIVYDQILDILKSHNVQQIKAVGEKFDPALHQAMMRREEPDKENHIVLEEFQTGYKLNGKVIRPSKVVVNQLPSEETEVEIKEETDQSQLSQEDIEADSEQ